MMEARTEKVRELGAGIIQLTKDLNLNPVEVVAALEIVKMTYVDTVLAAAKTMMKEGQQ